MSIASHAVNRLRNMWKTIYRRNAQLNAENFSYRRHPSATAPVFEQLEPRVLLSSTTIMDQNPIPSVPFTPAVLFSGGDTQNVSADVLSYIIANGEVTITDCDTAATGELTIPATIEDLPVTSIGDDAFSGCSGLTGVTISNRVTSVGEDAFYDCDSLTGVTIGDSVPFFVGNLMYLTIGTGVTSIGSRAFASCDALTSVTFKQDAPSSFGANVFDDAAARFTVYYREDATGFTTPTWQGYTAEMLVDISMLTYTIADGEVTIRDCDTYYWGDLTIPSTIKGLPVTSIRSYAFSNCRFLTSVTISDGVTSIGNKAFYNCDVLTTVTIPSSVTSIGNQAFHDCSALTSVTIPDGVTSIGAGTFASCGDLTSVTIPSSVTSIGGSAFSFCDRLTSLTIPDSVASIGDSAFSFCGRLTSLTIPDSVASIGDYAFQSCSGLTSVTIPSSVTSIGSHAFSGCRGLTSVTISDGVASIGSSAFFRCSGLTRVTIPSSVTTIGNSAFYDCIGLASVAISDGVTSIGAGAFRSCTDLTRVTIPSSVTSIGDRAFRNCPSLSQIQVDANNPNYTSQNGVLFNKDMTVLIRFPARHSAMLYVIPDGVTSIGSNAFSDSASLNRVIIPDGVTSIGIAAFSDCSTLHSVAIPGGVTSIGDYTFHCCDNLTSVTISEGVISIGDRAFSHCSGLTSVTIPDSVTSIGYDAFSHCLGLTSVTIPDGVTYIGSGAFSYCYGLTSVTIPSSVTSIGHGVFSSCTNLTSVTFEGDAPDLSTSTFSRNAYDLVVYYYDNATGFTTPTWKGRPAEIIPRIPVELAAAEKWSYSYTDANGDVVTVKLSGATDETTMTLYFYTDPAAEGFADDVQEIELSGTGPKTQLSISVKANKLTGDGTTTVEEISVTDGVLKAIKAKTTDLVGTGLVANAGGYVGSIDIRNLTNGADIILPGEGAAKGVSIKAGQFGDGSDVTLGSPLKGLAVAAWDDGELAAPWAKSIAIKGNKKLGVAADFGADITLFGVNARGMSLGEFSASGTATGEIRTASSIGSVTIASVNGFDLLAGIRSEAGRFPRGEDDYAGQLASVKSVKITGIKGQSGTFFQDSNIAAATIGSVSLCNADFDIGTSGIYALDRYGMGAPIKKVSYVNKALGEGGSWSAKNGSFNGPEEWIYIDYHLSGWGVGTITISNLVGSGDLWMSGSGLIVSEQGMQGGPTPVMLDLDVVLNGIASDEMWLSVDGQHIG